MEMNRGSGSMKNEPVTISRMPSRTRYGSARTDGKRQPKKEELVGGGWIGSDLGLTCPVIIR